MANPRKYLFDLSFDQPQGPVAVRFARNPSEPTFTRAELEAACAAAREEGRQAGLAEGSATTDRRLADATEALAAGLTSLIEREDEIRREADQPEGGRHKRDGIATGVRHPAGKHGHVGGTPTGQRDGHVAHLVDRQYRRHIQLDPRPGQITDQLDRRFPPCVGYRDLDEDVLSPRGDLARLPGHLLELV